MKKSLNHFGYCYTSFDNLYFNKLKGLYKIEVEFKNSYKTFELITNKGYWFKVRIHQDDLKNNQDDFYFSIYGENISCLALFEMHTRLKAITVNEFINNISSPYKVFTSN